MATRFYLTNAAAAVTPINTSSNWDDTAGALAKAMSTAKSGAATSTGIAETSTTNNWDVLLAKFVSRPIYTAGTLQGQVTAIVAGLESNASANDQPRMIVYVVNSAGTTIRGVFADVSGVEWGTSAAGQQLQVTGSAVSCQAGDRIVVAYGYTAVNTSKTSFTGTIFYGGTDATDLTAADTNTAHPSWVEFADGGVANLFSPNIVATFTGAGAMSVAAPLRAVNPTVSFAGAGSMGVAAQVNAVVMRGAGQMTADATYIGPLQGVWTAPTIAVPEGKIYGSQVVFDYTLLSSGQSVVFKASIDNGLTWQEIENYGAIPRLAPNSDFTRAVLLKAELNRPSGMEPTPRLHELVVNVDVNGTVYQWILLGVFSPTDVSVTESARGIEIGIEASDLSSKVSDNGWETIKTWPKDTNLGDVVKQIILDRYPQAEFDFESTTATALATLTVGTGGSNDPFADAAKVARKAGMVLYVNYKGVFVMRSPVDPDAAPVVGTLTRENRPIITELTRALTKTGTANRVVIEGESVNGSTPVRAQVDDTDPTSPNRIDGPEGIKVYRQIVKGVDANSAMVMAQAEALKRKGALETEEIDVVCQPQYEEGDVVLIDRETVGAGGRYVYQSFNLPFGGENSHVAVRRRALDQTSSGGNVGGLDGETAPSSGGGGGGGGGTTLRTYSTPGECHKIGTNGNLNHYKVQTAFTGGSDILERSQSQIGAGYANSPEYCMTADRTAVQMRVNLNAPTTSGSNNPRTEYREMDSNGTSNNGWNPSSGTHWAQSTFRFTHLPSSLKRCSGMQIHDADDVLQVKTEIVSGQLKIGYNKNGGSFVALGNYAEGDWVTVRIQMVGNTVSLWYHTGIDPVFSGGATTSFSVTHSGNCYFKIGTYPQSTSSESSSDHATGEYKKLGMSHPGYPAPVFDSDYLDSSGAGQIKIGFGACINASDSTMLGLLAGNCDWFFMLGDCWYKDGASPNWTADWNTKFSATNYASLLDSLPNPQVVLWSDHDFGYSNNSTGMDNPSRTAAANSAYRTQFGSSGVNVQGATLPSSGIYRTFDIGRVQVVCLDMLTFKSTLGSANSSSRTMLGSTQKAWYKNILAHPTQPVVMVFGDGQIPGPAEDGQDEWRGYAAERGELASSVGASPAAVIYCNSDTHSLAYGHDQYGYDRCWQSAPLNNATKVKAGGAGYIGQYPDNASEGPTKQMAAVITVVDNGDSVSLSYQGFEGTTQRLFDSITVNA